MRISRISDPMAAMDARISVSCGPMKFETTNCVPAKAMPQTAAAGQTSRKPRLPAITRIRYAGMNSETGAQRRPTPALRRSTGRPVVTASVVMGMAMEPKATGAVLASRQIAAA